MATRPARRTLQEAAVETLRNDLDEAGESRLYDVMGRFWHPVMYSSDLQGSPAKVILMEQQLVVVRLAGQVRCFPDLCVHRGTALSLGRVEDDVIRCAYHGWTYGPDGVCTSIPARFGTNIPSRARLRPHLVQERHGMIWVCLSDDPVFPIPDFPEHDDPAF